jgi:hypothetical protein
LDTCLSACCRHMLRLVASLAAGRKRL